MDLREKILDQIKSRARAKVKDMVLARRDRLRLAAAGDAETLDPVPHELAGMARPLSLRDELQAYIRREVSRAAARDNLGTFEDEDDFSEDDPEADMLSRYDVRNLVPEVPETLDGAPVSPAVPSSAPSD